MRTRLLLSLLTVLLACEYALADGCFFLRVEETYTSEESTTLIVEHSQRALIYYDPTSDVQRMVVEVRTESVSGECAWLVPLNYTPADETERAEVEEFQSEAFGWLEEITAPEVFLIRHYMELGNLVGHQNSIEPLGKEVNGRRTEELEVVATQRVLKLSVGLAQ